MHIALLLKGLVIGLSIAATVGPMSMLCIQRTLERGRLIGMLSGLGIATADGLYALIAGLGLTAIMHLLISQQLWIRLIGGLFLVYLGLKTILTRAIASTTNVQERTKRMAAFTSLFGFTAIAQGYVGYVTAIFKLSAVRTVKVGLKVNSGVTSDASAYFKA